MRVVNGVDPEAVGQKIPFEMWQCSVELVQRDFGNVALRHKEAGYFGSGVKFFPTLLFLPECVAFDPRDGCPDGATVCVFCCREGVDDACLHVAQAFLKKAVFAAEIPEHVDVVVKRGQAFQRAQEGGNKVPRQVVHLGNVGHEVAVVSVFKETAAHGFFGSEAHAFESFSHFHCGCSCSV